MCRVYNQIGCLTVIKRHLYTNDVNEYKSVNELINFQKNYSTIRQQIILNHRPLIEEEKNSLSDQIRNLENSIRTKRNEIEQQLQLELDNLKHQLDKLVSEHSNIIKTAINYLKKISIKRKVENIKFIFNSRVEYSLEHLVADYNQASNRYLYIESNFEGAVMESCSPQLQELDRKKRVIDEINNEIYGAIGEQKVVKELKTLPDDWVLINDFNCRFNPPIYNRQENDYIYSIQIDHILISPSGIFLIETKNWSQHSLNNLDLRSPIQQIKRTNFALYRLLNREVTSDNLLLNKHHWGDRKIPVKNLIVLINQKPIEEFQYVKVVTLGQLIKHITQFEPSFANNEIDSIANYLRKISG